MTATDTTRRVTHVIPWGAMTPEQQAEHLLHAHGSGRLRTTPALPPSCRWTGDSLLDAARDGLHAHDHTDGADEHIRPHVHDKPTAVAPAPGRPDPTAGLPVIAHAPDASQQWVDRFDSMAGLRAWVRWANGEPFTLVSIVGGTYDDNGSPGLRYRRLGGDGEPTGHEVFARYDTFASVFVTAYFIRRCAVSA